MPLQSILSALVHEPVQVLLKVLIFPIYYSQVDSFVILRNLHVRLFQILLRLVVR